MNPQAPSPPSPPVDGSNPRQQVIEQIKKSTNVLLTVSENPTVDQLAAVIGMTLMLNKLGKHATAVFSGKVPSTIEFLQPDKTLEKTTDSLRDFIISLDKSKADKLRYKVEDRFVKIFITPYHTSLSEKDLEFSQGDFNVDLVLALGVKKREEIDQAITSHGRILHDATVISINNTAGADIGSTNWMQTDASGLSEMLVGISEELKEPDQKLLDEQIATCFLTGIVAQTDRFSNAKTNPQTMSLAAKLMNAGANQQLIATKLEPPAPLPKDPVPPPPPPKPPEPPKPPTPPAPILPPKPPLPPKPVLPQAPPKPPTPKPKPADQPPAGPPSEEDLVEDDEEAVQEGSLLVPHNGITGDGVAYNDGPQENIAKIHIDDEGVLKRLKVAPPKPASPGGHKMMQPQTPPTEAAAATSTENNNPQVSVPDSAPISLPVAQAPAVEPLPLDSPVPHVLNTTMPQPELPKQEARPGDTLADLEKSVNSPHVHAVDAPAEPKTEPNNQLPSNLVGPDTGLPPDQTAGSTSPSAPPPVPPPLPMPPIRPNITPGNMSDPNSGVPL